MAILAVAAAAGERSGVSRMASYGQGLRSGRWRALQRDHRPPRWRRRRRAVRRRTWATLEILGRCPAPTSRKPAIYDRCSTARSPPGLMTEPQGGSDPGCLRRPAMPAGNRGLINDGEKWPTNASMRRSYRHGRHFAGVSVRTRRCRCSSSRPTPGHEIVRNVGVGS